MSVDVINMGLARKNELSLYKRYFIESSVYCLYLSCRNSYLFLSLSKF